MSPIQFQLFAPYNENATLIGCFSNWQEIPMQKGEDGYFRTQVDLQDGRYQYKFRVQSKSWHLEPNQWVEINDPYVKEIDQDSQNGVVLVKGGEAIVAPYAWMHDDTPLPPNSDLIIYEMHIADFSGGKGDSGHGKFQDVTAKLDYLKDLGINAIELLPVTEYAGDYRWGYLVRHFFAPESSYGPPEDLKRLIDECHARGIRVLMDGIYNHTDEDSPLLAIDRDYWYYHGPHYPEDPDNYWGPELNYEHYDPNFDLKPAWKFVGDVVRFWIQEYHIDGIRFDAVRQLANYDFLHWIAEEAKQAAGGKPFYNIAEHIPEATCITCCAQGPMDACWHESFRIFAIEHLCSDNFNPEKLKEALDARRQGFGTSTNVVNYLASHDREHTLTELGDRGIFDAAAFQRAKLGAVLLLTSLGIPMLWMGEEFGEYKHKTEVTTKPNKLEWELLKNDSNQDLLAFYKRLIELRKTVPALRTDNVDIFHENSENSVIAYGRWDDQGSRVVVIVNFSDLDFPVYEVPKFPAPGIWHDWIEQQDWTAEDERLAIALPPYSARVLVYQD
jgi:1,4-alpha-glucan branching enzyme